MHIRFLLKILTIGLLFLLLGWPLSMINGLISERTHFRTEVRTDIAQSWTGEQALIGPLLVVPYQVISQHQVWDEHLKSYRTEPLILRKNLFILPDRIEIQARVQTEERRRGLYAVPVYTSELDLNGRFTTAALGELAKEGNKEIKFEPAFVSLLISDLRGIVEQPRWQWQGKEIEFLSGSRAFAQLAGMHAVVGDLDPQTTQSFDFSTKINLRGMEQIRFSPVGKHVAWAYCHVPNGSTEDRLDVINAQIERFAPGFRDCILATHTMNCAEMESYNANYIGGDVVGGVTDLTQLFTRPVGLFNPYETPNPNIYICSASTPPGGGVHGMCGYWAAEAVLKKMKNW